MWGLDGPNGTDARTTGDVGPMPNYAFVTSMPVVPGDMGGTAGADAMCDTLAHTAGLDGHYAAWLSTSTDDASSRLEASIPRGWIRTDGKPFADTVNDIVHGNVWYPLRLTETGVDLGAAGPAAVVATGTKPDGTVVAGNACLDFKQEAGNVITGAADAGAYDWTDSANQPCSQAAHLYCFGIDRNAPVTVEPASTRMAFVTSEDLASGGGRATFDAECQREATAAQLPGQFRAAVATSTEAALTRFAAGTPWVRRDHVTVIGADLTVEAPIIFQPDGTAVPDQYVWAGAASLTAKAGTAAMSCNDWGSISGAPVTSGDPSRSGVWGFGGFTTTCQLGQRVYCLQD